MQDCIDAFVSRLLILLLLSLALYFCRLVCPLIISNRLLFSSLLLSSELTFLFFSFAALIISVLFLILSFLFSASAGIPSVLLSPLPLPLPLPPYHLSLLFVFSSSFLLPSLSTPPFLFPILRQFSLTFLIALPVILTYLYTTNLFVLVTPALPGRQYFIPSVLILGTALFIVGCYMCAIVLNVLGTFRRR